MPTSAAPIEIVSHRLELRGAHEAFREGAEKARGAMMVSAHFANPYVGMELFRKWGFRTVSTALPGHVELVGLIYPDTDEPPERITLPAACSTRLMPGNW